MNSKLFRKSNIERVNSPEQLNEYICVAAPGVWLVLAAVAVLLVGVLIWGIFGTVETTRETGMVVENGKATCYVSTKDATLLEKGLSVSAGEQTGSIKSVATTPQQAGDVIDGYLLYLTGLSESDFCCAVEVDFANLADGIYSATITVESVHPISFVIH